MNSDARVMFHYPYTAVTPAMAVTIAGVGSDYGMALRRLNGSMPLDGSKTYKAEHPRQSSGQGFLGIDDV